MTMLALTPCQQRQCIHYHRHLGPPEDPIHVCKAFPKGIPAEILSGENDHTEPVGGDDGIVFQTNDGAPVVYLRKKGTKGKDSQAAGDTVQAADSSAATPKGKETGKPAQDATEAQDASQQVTEKGYNPNQPRVPAGSPKGGQFASITDGDLLAPYHYIQTRGDALTQMYGMADEYYRYMDFGSDGKLNDSEITTLSEAMVQRVVDLESLNRFGERVGANEDLMARLRTAMDFNPEPVADPASVKPLKSKIKTGLSFLDADNDPAASFNELRSVLEMEGVDTRFYITNSTRSMNSAQQGDEDLEDAYAVQHNLQTYDDIVKYALQEVGFDDQEELATFFMLPDATYVNLQNQITFAKDRQGAVFVESVTSTARWKQRGPYGGIRSLGENTRSFKPFGEVKFDRNGFSVPDETPSVHLDYLSVNDSNKGVGRQLIYRQYQWMKEHGYHHADVNADINIGRYAWAREGFNLQGDTIGHAREKLIYWLELKTPKEFNVASKVPEFKTMQELATWRLTDDAGQPYDIEPAIPNFDEDITGHSGEPAGKTFNAGKAFLLDYEGYGDWNGRLHLENWEPPVNPYVDKAVPINPDPTQTEIMHLVQVPNMKVRQRNRHLTDRYFWTDYWDESQPAVKGYNPNQPRKPKGTPEGGQFATDAGSGMVTPKDVSREALAAAVAHITDTRNQRGYDWSADYIREQALEMVATAQSNPANMPIFAESVGLDKQWVDRATAILFTQRSEVVPVKPSKIIYGKPKLDANSQQAAEFNHFYDEHLANNMGDVTISHRLASTGMTDDQEALFAAYAKSRGLADQPEAEVFNRLLQDAGFDDAAELSAFLTHPEADRTEIKAHYQLERDSDGAVILSQCTVSANWRGWKDNGVTAGREFLGHAYRTLHPNGDLQKTDDSHAESVSGPLVDLMEFQLTEQGKGTGRAMIYRQYEWMKEHGYQQANVHADIDVGVYAWAKEGFEYKYPESAAEQRRFLVNWLEDRFPDDYEIESRVPQFSNVSEIANFRLTVDGREYTYAPILHGVDEPTEVEYPIGKAFMLDKKGHGDWQGTLDLQHWTPRNKPGVSSAAKAAGVGQTHLIEANPDVRALYPTLSDKDFWSDYLDGEDTAVKAMFTWKEGDHPRVPAGQPGAGRFAPKSMQILPGSFDRLPPEQRVWQGKQHEAKGPKPPKLAAGQFGEQVVAQVLTQLKGTPFGSLNVNVNNMPMDVIGDHWAVEVKAGLATNQKGAQAWRATIGEPGKAEQAALRTMSAEEKRRANEYKEAKILERKFGLLDKLSAEAGSKVTGKTLCCIVSEDLKRADVFMIDSFHLRLNWSQYATEEYYIGTFDMQSRT